MDMTCGDEMAARLSRLVDGELSPEELAAVEEHLSGCAACREMLSIFRRNESLLSNALSTEAFGNAVIESVMRSIGGEEDAPEARPVQGGFWEWLRERPLVPATAAAVLAMGIVAYVALRAAGRDAEMRALLERARAEAREARESASDLREEYEKAIRDMTVRWAMRDAMGFATIVYPNPNHYLVVRANFDSRSYRHYSVHRRDEGGDEFVRLNGEPLAEPVFTDTTAMGGKGYVYKFRAWRDDGSYAESSPILIRALQVPEGSLKVRCTKAAAPKDLAVFEIEKAVNGKSVKEEFVARLKEPIGGVRDVPGVGPVDFSTGHILERIEEGLQWIEVSYTTPMTDDKGTPIIEWVGKNSLVPATKTVHQNTPIAQRENRRAVLRPAGGASEEVHIWQGAWMWIKGR